MFRLRLIIALFMAASNILDAQITLASLDGRDTKKIKLGSIVKIKHPLPSANKECDCSIIYKGILRGTSQDSALLELKSSEAIYYEPNGIAKKTKTEYNYWGNHPKTTFIPLNGASQMTKIAKAEKNLDVIGGVMMILSAAHALLTAPLIKDDMRKTSDQITWGVFGAGLVMAIIPAQKKYHLTQPKGGNNRLWKITSPTNKN